jgi:hypothetical protein
LRQDRASRDAPEAPKPVLPAQNGAVRRKKALTIIVSNRLAKTIVVEMNQKDLPLPSDPQLSFERALARFWPRSCEG